MHQGRWYSRHGWWMDDDVPSEDGRGARLKIEDGSLPSRCLFLVCFGNSSVGYFLGLDSALDFALKCCSESYSGRSSWSNLFCSILGKLVKQFLSCVSESYTSRSSKGTARLLRWVRSSGVLVTVACYFEILLYPVEPRFRSCAFLFAGPLSSCIRSTAHAATFLSESLPWIRCLTGIPCLGWWSRCRLKLLKLMQQSNSIEYLEIPRSRSLFWDSHGPLEQGFVHGWQWSFFFIESCQSDIFFLRWVVWISGWFFLSTILFFSETNKTCQIVQ